MNAILTTTGTRPVLRMERRLPHPVEKVWRALTEFDQLQHWFPGAFTGDLVPGGRLHFAPSGPGEDASEGEVVEVDPPRLLAFTWLNELLRWELTPDGDGTLLVLLHEVDSAVDCASFAGGWTICLASLEVALGGAPEKWRMENWPALHEAFVEQFGLKDGTATADGDGVALRFARPLTVPPAEVKALLDAAEEPTVPGATAATIRLEDGPGGNARLVVEQRLPADADVPAALASWKTYVEGVAARLPGGTATP
jgi:uncharacterized protein YndB with AHSA1/START domain